MKYFLIFQFLYFISIQVSAQNITAADCKMNMKLVEKDSFVLLNGWKVIATVSIDEFDNNYACWLAMEKMGEEVLGDQTFGGIFFFTLSEDKVPVIEDKYDNFNRMSTNLVGKYWKKPNQKAEFIRFPNNQY